MNELGKLPKHKQIRRVLTEAEVSRLLSAVETPRDEALVLIILDCGLRLGEVAGMQRRDVMEDWVVVRGKVGDRRVPISSTLRSKLLELGNGEDIWMGKKGPLTRYGVQMVYLRLFKRAGISGPKRGPHTLRHTFATYYLRNGGGTSQLQDIMGHDSIETTMLYVHLAGVDVLKNHALYSPLHTLGLMPTPQHLTK